MTSILPIAARDTQHPAPATRDFSAFPINQDDYYKVNVFKNHYAGVILV